MQRYSRRVYIGKHTSMNRKTHLFQDASSQFIQSACCVDDHGWTSSSVTTQNSSVTRLGVLRSEERPGSHREAWPFSSSSSSSLVPEWLFPEETLLQALLDEEEDVPQSSALRMSQDPHALLRSKWETVKYVCRQPYFKSTESLSLLWIIQPSLTVGGGSLFAKGRKAVLMKGPTVCFLLIHLWVWNQ